MLYSALATAMVLASLSVSADDGGFFVELTGGPLKGFSDRARGAFHMRIDPAEYGRGYFVRGDQGKDLPNALPEFGGHYLDLCATYWEFFRDELARENGRRVVKAVTMNIDRDGYFGGEVPEHRLRKFSIWNQAHTVYGLSRFAAVTGDEEAKSLAQRGADWIVRDLDALDPMDLVDPTKVGNGGSQDLCVMLALEFADRLEPNPDRGRFIRRFLEGCEKTKMNLLSARGAMDIQSQKGIEMIVGYRGVLAYGLRYGFNPAVSAAVRYWRDLSRTQFRNTGGATLGECFTERGNEPVRLDIPQHPNETCVAAGWVRFSREIAAAEGTSAPADEMERSLFNHLLGSIASDGLDFAYFQGNFGKKVFWRNGAYSCCRSRGHAVAAHLPEFLFRRDGRRVHALVYADSIYRDAGLEIVERTAYPADGKIVFHATCKDEPRTLVLRIPRWCPGADISVDGIPLPAPAQGGTVDVPLAAGRVTEVELVLEMRFVRKPCRIGDSPCAEYAYGPLVLVRDTSFGGHVGDIVPAAAVFRKVAAEGDEIVRFETVDAAGQRTVLVDFASAGRRDPGHAEFEVYLPELTRF